MRDRLGEMLACDDMTREGLARHIRALRRALTRDDGTVRYGVLSSYVVAWGEMCTRQYVRRREKGVRQRKQ